MRDSYGTVLSPRYKAEMRTSGCWSGDVAGEAPGEMGDAGSTSDPGYDAGRFTTTDAVIVEEVVEFGLLMEASEAHAALAVPAVATPPAEFVWLRLARERRSGVGSLGGERLDCIRIWISLSSSSWAADSGVAPRWCFWGSDTLCEQQGHHRPEDRETTSGVKF
jgi:hypothetical protein